MTTKDTINEQTQKTEQVISQVTGMPAAEPVPKVESTTIEADVENTPPPDQLNTQAVDHLAKLITAIKIQVRQEVLAELLPLMEAMEKSAKEGVVQLQTVEKSAKGGVAQPQTTPQPAPPPTADFSSYVAGCEARAQELQNMVERKIEERRQHIYQRIQQKR